MRTYEIWHQAGAPNILDGLLSRLRLLFGIDQRHQRHQNSQKVVFASPSSKLSDCFDERCRLDISDGTTELNDANIWLFLGVVHWDPGNSLYPVLDCICQVWDYLHSSTEVVASSLLLDDVLVYLARSDVVLSGQSDIEVSFVLGSSLSIQNCRDKENGTYVPQVEINLPPIIENKHLAMLSRSHGP